MNLVGNDIVDLDDPAIATSHLRDRFVARVLSEAERERLSGASDAKSYVWVHLAAKEAAYKVVAKLEASPILAHRRFEVASDLRTIRYEEHELRLEVETGERFVHAVAWLGGTRPLRQVTTVAEGESHSLKVRQLLLAQLGGADELEVVRRPVPRSWDGFGPPMVLRRGARVEVDVSLSHDGRYAAWAFIPTSALTRGAPSCHGSRSFTGVAPS